jgi:hypothetical protein
MTRSRDVADTQDNLGGAVAPFVAGKNAVINGGIDIWQRGTSFAAPNYAADRWYAGGGNATYSQETNTANLPAGFRYGMKMTMAATDVPYFMQAIETANAIQFAGKKVVLSYYVSSTGSYNCNVRLDSGTATDTSVTGTYTQISATDGTSAVQSTTTTMTRKFAVYDVPSDCKTLRVIAGSAANITSGNSMTITGIQLEHGSVPTPFARAGGTIQGEIALCQRYYWRTTSNGTAATVIGQFALASSTTLLSCPLQFPVTMRVAPTSVDFSSLAVLDVTTSRISVTAVALDNPSPNIGSVSLTSSGLTAQRSYILYNQSAATGFIGFSAEL